MCAVEGLLLHLSTWAAGSVTPTQPSPIEGEGSEESRAPAACLWSEVFAVGQCGSFRRRQDRVPGAGREPLVRRRVADHVDRVEALFDARQLLAQKPPQHDDAGVRMRQVFE